MLFALNRCILGVALALSLTACDAFQNAPVKPIQLTSANAPSAYPIDGVTTATLLPASDYDLVTTRSNPARLGGPPVFCAQPSPDLATAFGETVQGGVNGGSGGVSGGVNGEIANTQSITALAGRTAGVVALRDGLYSACQAYANGMIGKDSYGLILSQYGNLLVALASSGTGSAADAAANAAIVQQQGVQAMLVACIAHNDQTTGVQPFNRILDTYCKPFMADFMLALPALLKPVPIPVLAAPKTPAPAAQTASQPSKPAAASTIQEQNPGATPASGARAP